MAGYTDRNRCFKRESTQGIGLPTPNMSMTTVNDGNLSEDMHETTVKKYESQTPDDEGYVTQVVDVKGEKSSRDRRSVSPSLVSISRKPTSTPSHDYSHSLQNLPPRQSAPPSRALTASVFTDPSVVERMAAPGASLQLVGEKVNILVNTIEELRKLGLQEVSTELPELVLIGDQSAGKSSLMGAIAEINLPKDNGMCTRCPANIKTSPAETWQCTVSLHETYNFTKDARRVPTSSRPFPPWVERVNGLVINRFATISDKSELENVLRWAQIALLNPSQDYHNFIPGSGNLAQNGLGTNYKHEATFSPNIVAIEISGPRLPALSFYDLPGIFQHSANKEESPLIEVFENLAKKYIKHENALIICAKTMANDPGNSRTSAIIEKLNAEDRTIGVLTLPDRLNGSTHLDYDNLLRGKKYVLPRGYFITKQPGPDFVLRNSNSDYHAQAREEERSFFASDPRWNGEWAEFQHRCGTPAIQAYLSEEFAKLIYRSMPSIDEKIREQILHVEGQLSRLPEMPNENAQYVVRQCLRDFGNHIQNVLGGHRVSFQNNLMSQWSELSTDFMDAIQLMKPKFIIRDPSDEVFSGREVINLDDDDDSDTASLMASPSVLRRKAPVDFNTSAAKRLLFSNGSVQTPSASPSANGQKAETPRLSPFGRFAQPRGSKPTVFSPYLNAGKSFMTIAEVRRIITNHRRPGHPDNVTDSAREEICLQAVGSWGDPLNKLKDETFAMLNNAVLQALQIALGNYQKTDLYRQSKALLRQFIRAHQDAQASLLDNFYSLETYKLFTVNNTLFLQYKTEELHILQAARRSHRVRTYAKHKLNKNMKDMTEKEKIKLEKDVTDSDLGADPFSLEIETAAYVRGYYRTAGNRFADVVCQSILGNLFRNIDMQIPFFLENKLGLNEGDSDAKCRNLMVENHQEAAQREALQEERSKLTQASEHLEKLVQDLNIAPDVSEVDPFDDDDNEDMADLPIRRSVSQTLENEIY